RFEKRQPAPARTGSIAEHADVADLVANQRHGKVAQIRDDDGAGLAKPRRPPIDERLDEHTIGVDVQSPMFSALTSDQADFLATVAVRDAATEDGFNSSPLPIMEDHGGRDNSAWPVGRQPPTIDVVGEQED